MDSPWVTREGTECWDTGFLALKVTPRLQMEVHCLGFGEPAQELLPASFCILSEE